MKAAAGDELLQRRIQTDPGVRQWLAETMANIYLFELERRIKAGEIVREKQEDGSTHVRRA